MTRALVPPSRPADPEPSLAEFLRAILAADLPHPGPFAAWLDRLERRS